MLYLTPINNLFLMVPDVFINMLQIFSPNFILYDMLVLFSLAHWLVLLFSLLYVVVGFI